MTGLFQDLRYAIRQLHKNPGFVTVAVLILALGIGANTAIFSAIDTLLLKSLPVRDPQQLALLSVRNIRGEISSTFSYPLFAQLRADQHSFSGLAAATGTGRMLAGIREETPEQANVDLVSSNYFEVLGVSTKLGQTFVSDDGQPTIAQSTAVLSYPFWTHHFGARENPVGSTIRIKDHPFTIIGVTAPGFFGDMVGESPDIWIPVSALNVVLPGRDYLHATNTDWLRLIARLGPRTSEQQAQADLQILVDRLKSEENFRRGMPEGTHILVSQGSKGFSYIRERFARTLKVLMAAVCFVLLIACVNVANLILARNTGRQREFAIRLAVGASRWRVLRFMLVENALISGLGASAGMLLAFSGVDALLPLFAERGDPAVLVHLDGRVLAFAIAVCILTALLFSLQPAFGAMRWKDLPALQNRTNSAGRSRGSLLGGIFVVWQVALSLMLVSGATLLVRSLLNLRNLDPGFSRDNVLFVRIDPVSAGYGGSRAAILDRGLLQEVRAIPGVVSVSMSDLPLMGGKNQTCCIVVPGYSPASGERMAIRHLGITSGYFGTVGMRLISGRDFSDADSGSKPSRGIVDEAFAKRYFGNQMAIGKSFYMGSKDAVQIIGVVKDAKYDGIRADVPPMVFFSTTGDGGTLWSLQVRTTVDPESIEGTIRRVIARVDPSLPISEMITVKSLIDDSLAEERLLASLSSLFGLLGLGIATIGVYGLISADVGQRTNEIGIRMALGADRHQIAGMILRQTTSLVLLGSACGLAASLAGSRLISSFLFGITATNGWAFGMSCAILLSAGIVAGYIPARRAAKVDPVVALRYE